MWNESQAIWILGAVVFVVVFVSFLPPLLFLILHLFSQRQKKLYPWNAFLVILFSLKISMVSITFATKSTVPWQWGCLCVNFPFSRLPEFFFPVTHTLQFMLYSWFWQSISYMVSKDSSSVSTVLSSLFWRYFYTFPTESVSLQLR